MSEDELDDILNREATRRAIGQPVCADEHVKVFQTTPSRMRDIRVEQIDRTITMLQTYRAMVIEGVA